MKNWQFDDIQTWGPGQHELGAAIPVPGTADKYETGGWRVRRPIHDQEKCTNCMICYWGCPDSSIVAEAGKMVGIDLKHCKGCGICVQVCPHQALVLENELKIREQEEKR